MPRICVQSMGVNDKYAGDGRQADFSDRARFWWARKWGGQKKCVSVRAKDAACHHARNETYRSSAELVHVRPIKMLAPRKSGCLAHVIKRDITADEHDFWPV